MVLAVESNDEADAVSSPASRLALELVKAVRAPEEDRDAKQKFWCDWAAFLPQKVGAAERWCLKGTSGEKSGYASDVVVTTSLLSLCLPHSSPYPALPRE